MLNWSSLNFAKQIFVNIYRCQRNCWDKTGCWSTFMSFDCTWLLNEECSRLTTDLMLNNYFVPISKILLAWITQYGVTMIGRVWCWNISSKFKLWAYLSFRMIFVTTCLWSWPSLHLIWIWIESFLRNRISN